MLEHFRINRIEHFVRTESTKEKKQGRPMDPLILQKIQPRVYQVCVHLSGVILLGLVRFLRFHLLDVFLIERKIFNKI